MPVKTKQTCPGCESEQTFARRTRHYKSTPLGNVLEVFIACTNCPWSQSLGYSTTELERVRKIERRLAARSRVQIAKHGAASSSVERMLSRALAQVAKEEQVLEGMLSS